MPRFRSWIPVSGLLACTVIFLVGCVSQSETVATPVSVPEAFSRNGADVIPERWWTVFDDGGLNATVDAALTSNLDLRTAWERLQAAEAIVDREAAALLPDLEGFVFGEMSRSRNDGGETVRLGVSSVYEGDLWGRIRSAVDAERFRAEASLADYRTAALSLSAEIARTWYQLAEALNALALIEEQIETNADVLELLENRLGAGQVRSVDILRQRQLVAATREQGSNAASRIRVLEHRLSILSGRSPHEGIEMTPEQLPELSAVPETGLPIELIRRRPDVRSAFYLLQAADRDLAAAIANRYPRLSLSASASSAAGGRFGNWILSLAGDLIAPLFYGRELGAEVDRTEAVKGQHLFEYGQTVLVALQEVEDALTLESNQVESIEHIEEQLNLAEQAYEQLQVEYFNGTSNYIDVLTALDDLQQLRRDLLAAELTLVEYRIALYRALAGSFETVRETEE